MAAACAFSVGPVGAESPTEPAESSNQERTEEEKEATILRKQLGETPAPTGFVTSISAGGSCVCILLVFAAQS